jgi:hypothetical protein
MRYLPLLTTSLLLGACGEMEYHHFQQVDNATNKTLNVEYHATDGGYCSGDTQVQKERIRPGVKKDIDVRFRNDLGGCGLHINRLVYYFDLEANKTTIKRPKAGILRCKRLGKGNDCRWHELVGVD